MTTKMEKLSQYLAPASSPQSKYFKPAPDYKRIIELEKEVADLRLALEGVGEVVFDIEGALAELAALRDRIDRQTEINAKQIAKYEQMVFDNLEASK